MRVWPTIALGLASLAAVPCGAFGQAITDTVRDSSKPRQVLLLHSFDASFDVLASPSAQNSKDNHQHRSSFMTSGSRRVGSTMTRGRNPLSKTFDRNMQSGVSI
jgi:hypothetical protein